MESILGNVAVYAAHTAAVFQVPVAVLFLILLGNETQLPQNYKIRHLDLQYYLQFTLVAIFPRLIMEVFLLHVMECLHGYKIFDYFMFCDYRFRIRTKKWQVEMPLDRAVAVGWRSIDGFSFSSQFYFAVGLSSWGILFLYLGLTAMMKNDYNPFADPCLVVYVFLMTMIVQPIGKIILSKASEWVGLWAPPPLGSTMVDAKAVNFLDRKYKARKLAHNI